MVTKTIKSLWNDESAQGSTEYILLLAIVVIIAVLFRGKITEMVKTKLDELNTGMGQINPSQGT